MNFFIAVDPGTTRTGVVIFQDGKWVSKRVLEPKAKRGDKCPDLWELFDNIIFDLEDRFPGCVVERIAIEDYRGFVRTDRKNSIPILAEWIGYLRAKIDNEYPDVTVQIMNKGNTRKEKAKQLALAAGIPEKEKVKDKWQDTPQDIFDAYMIGVLAGFGE